MATVSWLELASLRAQRGQLPPRLGGGTGWWRPVGEKASGAEAQQAALGSQRVEQAAAETPHDRRRPACLRSTAASRCPWSLQSSPSRLVVQTPSLSSPPGFVQPRIVWRLCATRILNTLGVVLGEMLRRPPRHSALTLLPTAGAPRTPPTPLHNRRCCNGLKFLIFLWRPYVLGNDCLPGREHLWSGARGLQALADRAGIALEGGKRQ